MATSTIKYKSNIVTVASTGTASEAYSAKLNRLASAYSSLTGNQRRASFLRDSDSNIMFYINYSSGGTARYINHTISASHCHIYQYSIVNNASSAFDVDITSGGNSITDVSSTVTTHNIDLCYYT